MLATVGPEQYPYRAVSIQAKQALKLYVFFKGVETKQNTVEKIQQQKSTNNQIIFQH